MKPNIFISYSHRDTTFARRLAISLTDSGADVWIDTEDIPAGMKWSTAIQQGLLRSEIMIVIVSPASMQSKHVEDEWQYYLDMGKPIIPILWQPTPMHFQLSRIQYVDFHHQAYNVALLDLFTELVRLGCEVNIPNYLEPTRNHLRPPSNAHPTHMRPPTKPMNTHQEVTRKSRPRLRQKYYAAAFVAGAIALSGTLFLSAASPTSSSPNPDRPITEPTAKPPRVVAPVNINIRSAATMTSNRVAVIRAGDKALILGVNASRTWWYIQYNVGGETYTGWVAANIVQTRGEIDSVPVIDETAQASGV